MTVPTARRCGPRCARRISRICDRWSESGKVVVGGPFTDGSGSLIVVDFENEAAAKAFAQQRSLRHAGRVRAGRNQTISQGRALTATSCGGALMAGALSSLKVVEIGEMVSAPYASKLMADMGAEVIKVERPGVGDHARVRGPFPGGQPHPEKSGLFLYLNTNKLGVTLDMARPEGFELLEKLVAQRRRADSQRRAIRHGPCRAQFRAAAQGQSAAGDDLDYAVRADRAEARLARGGSDAVVARAASACSTAAAPDHPEMPPLKTFGHQSGFQGGVHAAVATMGAVMAQMRDGEGQHVDVSIHESLASQLELFFEYWPYMKHGRLAPGHRSRSSRSK